MSSIEFKSFIIKTLKLANISSENLDILTSDKCMTEYTRAFTTKKYNPDFNYEFYEILGDSTSNKIVVWYFMRRFPDLFQKKDKGGIMGPVGIMARLKIEGVSKKTYSQFANQLGFYNWILATPEEKLNKAKLLEDTFEAFIGCTESLIDNLIGLHCGYAVVYEIMKTIMDKKTIDLDIQSLYDHKSLLNMEIHKLNKNKYPHIKGKKFELKYISEKLDIDDDIEKIANHFKTQIIIHDIISKRDYKSDYGYGFNKDNSEQETAKLLLSSGLLQRIK